MPILISLGAKLAALKTFYVWVARVAIVCIHVHECPSRHRHQEERSVLQFFFVAPRAACRLHAEVAPRSACRRCASGIVIRMCAKGAVCARAWKPMVRIILLPAGVRRGTWPWKPCICRVRHFAVAASWKVDASATANEGKSAPITGSTRWASPSARSAQIKGAVRVHQESLIR